MPWPLVDLSLVRNGRFAVLVIAGAIANIAYAVAIVLSTLNLQQVRGLDPLMAGLVFLGPWPALRWAVFCRAALPQLGRLYW